MPKSNIYTHNKITNLLIKAGILTKSSKTDLPSRLFLTPLSLSLIKNKSNVPFPELEDEIISSLLAKTIQFHEELTESQVSSLVSQLSCIYQYHSTDIESFFV